MPHTCHAHGCKVAVPPKMFMCRAHWFALRRPIQQAIWREYRPGQENDKQASLRYLAVQQRAIGELVFRPNDEAAASASTVYLLTAEVMRTRAIDAGQGDPLQGLVPTPPMSTAAARAVADKMTTLLSDPDRDISPEAERITSRTRPAGNR